MISTKLDALTEKLRKTKEELEKARKKLSDEHDPNDMGDAPESEGDELGEGYREFNPDEEATSGDDWLKENDPDHDESGKYDEYDEDEDEDSHQKDISEDFGDDSTDQEVDPSGSQAEVAPTKESAVASPKIGGKDQVDSAQEATPKRSSRWIHPSRDDIASFRKYTRPWEQQARDRAALSAEPSKNPQLAHHGNIIEARNTHHADRSAAYRAFTTSGEYKNADPIAQMEMDDNFEKDWSAKNPNHLKTALNAHHEAHQKGKSAKELHAASKDAQIRNILTGGGHGGEGYSLEEGMQHAGGVKGEDGTQATVKRDPASSFAVGNPEFIRQYAQDYEKKAKKVGNIDDMHNYDEGSKRDISRILGEGPTKDSKFEKFFEHYHPLIGMNAHKTLQRLGLDPKHPDIDLSVLHEAGMHGLIQAVNDYDHDNSSKASFATHAANKIRGLQMTAMKNQDAIPHEVRQAQKKFVAQRNATPAPKQDLHSMIKQTNHPLAPDMTDRLKRVGAQRQAQATVKIRKPSGSAGGQPDGGQ